LYITAPETRIMTVIGYLAKCIDPAAVLGEAVIGQRHWSAPVFLDPESRILSPGKLSETVAEAGSRTPAQALEALNRTLLLRDSATRSLEEWCHDHGVNPAHRVVAEVVHAGTALLPAERRRLLGVGPSEPVHLRRVRLSCSGIVLSEACIWYVPVRLTAEMRQRLERNDAPFGRVVEALRFRRIRFSTEPLWDPAKGGQAPVHVLRHHALLITADGGVPFSEVEETYTREALFLTDSRQ
jgi:chorismate-pyruvate lyase